jgi:hypothetical protein
MILFTQESGCDRGSAALPSLCTGAAAFMSVMRREASISSRLGAKG